MHTSLLPALAVAALAGSAAPPTSSDVPLWNQPTRGSAACRSAIHAVREAAGLSRLEDVQASDLRPELYAAVDRRIDGCRALVTARNLRDIRPEPELAKRPPRLLPALRAGGPAQR